MRVPKTISASTGFSNPPSQITRYSTKYTDNSQNFHFRFLFLSVKVDGTSGKADSLQLLPNRIPDCCCKMKQIHGHSIEMKKVSPQQKYTAKQEEQKVKRNSSCWQNCGFLCCCKCYCQPQLSRMRRSNSLPLWSLIMFSRKHSCRQESC